MRQETRHWDETDGRTHTLRTKEDADDYRYFLEPDLVPLVPDAGVDRAGPRPRCRCCRRPDGAALAAATGAAVDGEAVGVVVERGQDDYVLAVAAAGGDAGAGPRPRQGGVRRAGRASRRCRPPTSPR